MVNPDHTHTCARCGFVWPCVDYTEKQCRAKGVFRGAQVNKRGPYCELCRCGMMFLRYCDNRGIEPVKELHFLLGYDAELYPL